MIWSADYLDRDRGDAVHTQGAGPTGGKIDNAASNEGPTIIDAAVVLRVRFLAGAKAGIVPPVHRSPRVCGGNLRGAVPQRLRSSHGCSWGFLVLYCALPSRLPMRG